MNREEKFQPQPLARLLLLILLIGAIGLLETPTATAAQPLISELEPERIAVGQRLTIHLEGFNDTSVNATVSLGGVEQQLDPRANKPPTLIIVKLNSDTPTGEQLLEVKVGAESAVLQVHVYEEPGSNRLALFAATLLFVGVYVILITEKIHRTSLAMIGAVLMLATLLLTGLLEPAESLDFVIEKVDWNTIGLLLGMMILVAVLMETGVFPFVGLYVAQQVKGDYWKIMLLFSTFTAIASAFLDNVTTIMLMVPVTISISKALEFRPIPLIIAQVLASNVGGAATLIGDPPNIIIGSGAGITFNEFAFHMAGPVIITFLISIFLLKFFFKKDLDQQPRNLEHILKLDPWDEITDMKTLKLALGVLGATILGFVLHGALGLEPSIIALTGAASLLVITRIKPEKAFHHVEWPTLMFFAGLFIIVGGVEEAGLIHLLAQKAIALTGGNLWVAIVVIMLVAAIASAFVDNIPFTATMVPIIITMSADPLFGDAFGNYKINPLWWALALGADFGGNGTLVGASANLVAAGLSERQGFPIRFTEFLKVGFPFMLITVFIGLGLLLLFMQVPGWYLK